MCTDSNIGTHQGRVLFFPHFCFVVVIFLDVRWWEKRGQFYFRFVPWFSVKLVTNKGGNTSQPSTEPSRTDADFRLLAKTARESATATEAVFYFGGKKKFNVLLMGLIEPAIYKIHWTDVCLSFMDFICFILFFFLRWVRVFFMDTHYVCNISNSIKCFVGKKKRK